MIAVTNSYIYIKKKKNLFLSVSHILSPSPLPSSVTPETRRTTPPITTNPNRHKLFRNKSPPPNRRPFSSSLALQPSGTSSHSRSPCGGSGRSINRISKQHLSQPAASSSSSTTKNNNNLKMAAPFATSAATGE